MLKNIFEKLQTFRLRQLFETAKCMFLPMLLMIALTSCNGSSDNRKTNYIKISGKFQHKNLYNPADIIIFKGKFVATELNLNKLTIFDDLALTNIRHFDPKSIGKEFKGPHFLAISPSNTLLVSDGWGESIIEIKELDGSGWKSFSGTGPRFRSPHGICVDNKGWIYVGDSLNSRLVRFRDMEGKDWQVFSDKDKKIGYIREMVFHNGSIWISNSYEKLPGINKGKGSNILKIDNFESGKAIEVIKIKNTNCTGLMPAKDRIVFGTWVGSMKLMAGSISGGKYETIKGSACDLGIPYGMFSLPENNIYIAAYIGSISKEYNGGFITLSLEKTYD